MLVWFVWWLSHFICQVNLIKYAIVNELDNCGGCKVALGPPDGLRPARCITHHLEPKGLVHKHHNGWRMRESNPPPQKVSIIPYRIGIFIGCSKCTLSWWWIVSLYPPIFFAVNNLSSRVWLVLLQKYPIPEPIIGILAMPSAWIRKKWRRQMQYYIITGGGIKSSLNMRGLHNTSLLEYTIPKTRSIIFRFPKYV